MLIVDLKSLKVLVLNMGFELEVDFKIELICYCGIVKITKKVIFMNFDKNETFLTISKLCNKF